MADALQITNLDHSTDRTPWRRARPSQFQLQRWSGACNVPMKDELERQLSTMVCAGDATLTGAQDEIGTDWCAAYKSGSTAKAAGSSHGETQTRLKLESDPEPHVGGE